ncbi:hypothetical protein [Cupriavidus agavae]|uniref:Uncharacterized protein n=1 Tax=Cupriavidus agavae TaxID=1001822 RepID=A0A4Q7S6U2_9BURK|nr:hypothetical protein [Cupriavidus agavae]RZT42101.1 hypothetical protein EV147_1118 [Cupriavidus agavae]
MSFNEVPGCLVPFCAVNEVLRLHFLFATTDKDISMQRRQFLPLLLVSLLGTSGCVTRGMYEADNYPDYELYTETVSQILMSQDGKKLVVVAPLYHYIFDAPPGLVDLLNSPLREKLSANFSVFTVTRENAVSGNVEVKGTGAKQPALTLHGTRYRAGTKALPLQAEALNQTYAVTVREETPSAPLPLKILATPLTVAADGVIVLLAIPLVPIFAVGIISGAIPFRIM